MASFFRTRCRMTLSGYFMSNSVFLPAVLDSDGSTFKDNCVKSNERRPILSAAKYRSMTIVSGNISCLYTFEGFSRRTPWDVNKDSSLKAKDSLDRTKDSAFVLKDNQGPRTKALIIGLIKTRSSAVAVIADRTDRMRSNYQTGFWSIQVDERLVRTIPFNG